MTLSRKIGLCLGATIGLSLVIGISASVALSNLRTEVEVATIKGSATAGLINDIRMSILGFRFAERGILLFTQANGQAKVEASKQQFATATSLVLAKVGELRPQLAGAAAPQLADTIQSAVEEYVRVQAQIPVLCAEGKVLDAMKIDMEQLVPAGTRATKAAEELLKIQQAVNAESQKRANGVFHTANTILLVLLGLSLGVAVAAWVVTARSTKALRLVAGNLLSSSDHIQTAALQVSTSSQALADGASKQAAAVEESSASAQEVAAMAKQNLTAARETEQLIVEAQRLGEESGEAVQQMAESMNRINSSTTSISKVIRVIDEIAFQTNILALNAAVEAARAGAAGMGFAVVADEVRNLAQRSAEAAKETGGMIEASIVSANEGTGRIELVTKSFASNAEIRVQLKQRSGEIASASAEQARGIDQIATAVQAMSQMAEGTAAQAEESAAASGELTQEAGSLREMVDRLESLVGRA